MTNLSSAKQVFHLSNRLTFGMNEKVINDINKQGIDNFITQQLEPDNINNKTIDAKKEKDYPNLTMSVQETFNTYNFQYINHKRGGQELSTQEKREIRKKTQKFFNETLEFKIYKSVNNPRQLQELMTDFWFNHFNIYVNKIPDNQRFLIHSYENNAIQPFALGKFRDLLQATAQHPSMLYYLDNWRNVNPKGGKGKGVNENYARELMELHTLGVNGGYTQDDVINLARILTGWGIMTPKTPQSENGFYFNEKSHDYGDKIFLGRKIKGSGIEEVYQALDILASHPSTANYISYKLAQFFVADNPPDTLVKKLANTFLESEGNIKIILTKLFNSDEFWDTKFYGNKFKTPYQYVVSLFRISNIKNPPLNISLPVLRNLSMIPYHCVTPDGYKNIKSAWLSPDSVVRRVNFATNIANGKLKENSNLNIQIILNQFGNFYSENTINLITNNDRQWQLALSLGSPEMMYK